MSAATSLSRRGILILTAVILVLALGAFFAADTRRAPDGSLR